MYFVYSNTECLGYLKADCQMDALRKAKVVWKGFLWVEKIEEPT